MFTEVYGENVGENVGENYPEKLEESDACRMHTRPMKTFLPSFASLRLGVIIQ